MLFQISNKDLKLSPELTKPQQQTHTQPLKFTLTYLLNMSTHKDCKINDSFSLLHFWKENTAIL